MTKWGKRILTLALFSLIGIMFREETIHFMFASNLSTTENIGLVDLTIHLLTSPLLSVYWILPLTFGLFYFNKLDDVYNEDFISLLLTRYQNRHSFMYNQFLSLIMAIYEYIFYLIGGSFAAWIIFGHRFTAEHSHYIINYSSQSSVISTLAILLLYITLGLIMIGLITHLLFLTFKHGVMIFLVLLGLCLLHTISYTFDMSDTITALLPFTQFSRGSSVLFYPFGLTVSWYTPLVQMGYLIILNLVLLFFNLKKFKNYEV